MLRAHEASKLQKLLTYERLCVSDSARSSNMSISLASQHLKILEITKLLIRKKEGRTVYFRINTDDKLVRTLIKSITYYT